MFIFLYSNISMSVCQRGLIIALPFYGSCHPCFAGFWVLFSFLRMVWSKRKELDSCLQIKYHLLRMFWSQCKRILVAERISSFNLCIFKLPFLIHLSLNFQKLSFFIFRQMSQTYSLTTSRLALSTIFPCLWIDLEVFYGFAT